MTTPQFNIRLRQCERRLLEVSARRRQESMSTTLLRALMRDSKNEIEHMDRPLSGPDRELLSAYKAVMRARGLE